MVDETNFNARSTEDRIYQLERDYADLAELKGHERELVALRRDLDWVFRFFADYLGVPRHSGGCSNQNAVNPYGAYVGAQACGCVKGQYGNTVFPEDKYSTSDGIALTNISHPVMEFPTLESLVDAVEKLFDCRDGVYGSFAVEDGKRQDGYYYRTLCIITDTSTQPETRLRQQLYTDLLDVYATCASALEGTGKKPILYWRFAKQVRITEEMEKPNRYVRYKIRTRIAVPEADWSRCDSLKTEGEAAKRI